MATSVVTENKNEKRDKETAKLNNMVLSRIFSALPF